MEKTYIVTKEFNFTNLGEVTGPLTELFPAYILPHDRKVLMIFDTKKIKKSFEDCLKSIVENKDWIISKKQTEKIIIEYHIANGMKIRTITLDN